MRNKPYGFGGELLELKDLEAVKELVLLRISEKDLTLPEGPFWKNQIVPALRSGKITSSFDGVELLIRSAFEDDMRLSDHDGFEESPYIITLSGDELVFIEAVQQIEEVHALQGVIDFGRNHIESTLHLPEWLPELGISELLWPIFSWNGTHEEFNDFIGALRTETKQIHPQNCLVFLLELLKNRFGKKLSAGFEIDYKAKMIRVGTSWYDIVKGSEGLEIEYNPQLPDWCDDEIDVYPIIKRAIFFEGNTNTPEVLQELLDFLEPRVGSPGDNNILLGRLFQEISTTGYFMPNNIVKVEVFSGEGELRLKVTSRDFTNSDEGYGPYGPERYHDVTFNMESDLFETDMNSYDLKGTLSPEQRLVFFFDTPTVINGIKVDADDQFTDDQFQELTEKLCELHDDKDINKVVSGFLHATLVRMKECCGDDSLELRDISVLPFSYNYKVFIDGIRFQYIALDGTDVRIASIGV